MEAFLTTLSISILIGFCIWVGWMWGNMSGYEEGFKARDRIQKEAEQYLKKFKR